MRLRDEQRSSYNTLISTKEFYTLTCSKNSKKIILKRPEETASVLEVRIS